MNSVRAHGKRHINAAGDQNPGGGVHRANCRDDGAAEKHQLARVQILFADEQVVDPIRGQCGSPFRQAAIPF